jgi:polyphenol oxidase
MQVESNSFCAYGVTDKEFGPVVQRDANLARRLGEALDGETAQRRVWMNQVHGANIEYVGSQAENDQVFTATDGLWTDQPGVMLVVRTADCVPILLSSPEAGVVAALHCGWRGFCSGMIEAFADLCSERGFAPSSFEAFMGPHLRAGNFEVQADFVAAIEEPRASYVLRNDTGYQFDLSAGVRDTLRAVGITRVRDDGTNSYSDPNYFSYRFWTHQEAEQRPASYPTFASVIAIRQ